ncbi:MAG: protein TolB [Nitrospinaceae bacterium]|nr:MAG: protein TolB [Nitrospinaceae bacterium]
MIPKLILAVAIWLQLFSVAALAEPKIRIDLQRETRKKVNIAIPEFVLQEKHEDPEGLGKTSRGILENDLKLSEYFVLIDRNAYKEIALAEQKVKTVDYASWSALGAQWLLKTQYKINPLDKSFNVTFRLYDTATERFLLGKRYTTTRKFLRKIIHRFADEVVMQLTGKRGIAETKIAFLTQSNGSKEVYTIDFDGHGLQKITDEKSIILTPAWSPDGGWIVYTSYAARNPDLVMISASGQKRRTLLKLPGLNAAPAWSPNGQRIAMVLSKDRNSEIYVLEKNFGLKRLTRHFNIDTSPTWSPDGKQIAFTSDRSGTGAPQIYIMSVKSGDEAGVKRISFGSGYNDDPAWSPDGEKIAFTSRVGKKFQIKIYDLKTKKNEQFTFGPGSSEQPAWSPDGRFIVYRHKEKGQLQIFIKSLTDKKPRQLTFVKGGGYSPAWSPHSRR